MQLKRRSVLSGMAAAAACPICLASGVSAEEAHGGHEKHWTYEGDTGPEHWGELKPDYKSCSIGTQQSPINLAKPVHASLSQLVLNWKPFPLTVSHNGHTIVVNIPPGNTTTEGDGEVFNLIQFHIHHPSEHLVDGKTFALEAHFVHFNEKKDAALVIGVFMSEGASNESWASVFANMPKEKGDTKTTLTLDATKLLPTNHDRYRYEGSLTTPACGEIVHWNVLKVPMTATADQIKAVGALFSNNARPVLPLNRRFLLDG